VLGGAVETCAGPAGRWSCRASCGIRDDFKRVLRQDPCAVCPEPGDTVDHIEPRSRGGRSRVDNLTGMCLEHNREKDDETLLRWLLNRRVGSI